MKRLMKYSLLALLSITGLAQGASMAHRRLARLTGHVATVPNLTAKKLAVAKTNASVEPQELTPEQHKQIEDVINDLAVERDAFDCAKEGDIEQLKKLMAKSDFDVNARNFDGYTLLMVAARYNTDENMVHFLVTSGADRNLKDPLGNTAAERAGSWGCPKIADYLDLDQIIAKSTDINQTLRLFALKQSWLAMTVFMAKNPAFVIENDVLSYVLERGGGTDVALKLVSRVDVNQTLSDMIFRASYKYASPDAENIARLRQESALRWKNVQWLIDVAHADVNAIGKYEKTPFADFVYYTSRSVVVPPQEFRDRATWLVSRGADRIPALVAAADERQWNILLELITMAPLHIRAMTPKVKRLIELLFRYIHHGNAADGDLIVTIIKLLVECGVDPRFVLMQAADQGHLPLIQWLLQVKQVPVDTQDDKGMTALMHSVCSGNVLSWSDQRDGRRSWTSWYLHHIQVVRWLVTEAKANLWVRCQNRRTALDYANFDETRSYLRPHYQARSVRRALAHTVALLPSML